MTKRHNYYVIDTSALLFDPLSLLHFSNSNIVIPVCVLEELDKHKDRLDDIGNNARNIIRTLYELKKEGNISKGVIVPNTGISIRIMPENIEDIPTSLNPNLNDNKILGVCLSLVNSAKKLDKVILVTNDLNLGLKAEAYNIENFNFQPEEKYTKTDYKGYRELEELEDLCIDEIYLKKFIPCPNRLKAIENEHFLIKNTNTNKSILVINKDNKLHRLNDALCYSDIRPLNIEQKFAMNLLLDPNIKLVTLTGTVGSGKTFLSAACGLFQCIEKHRTYSRLMISRSLVLLSGKDNLGFLKGGLKEKLDPYMLPLKDAIDQVIGDKKGGFDYLTSSLSQDGDAIGKPKIEIEPLQYIRGRSLRDSFFIIDEAQNLTLSEVKAIISRAGENCKIVLLGDIKQIDRSYLSKYTNGLSQVIERFKGSKIAGHISLKEGVRSQLASESDERL